MSDLIEEIGDLWGISLGLVRFYHECCYNCQPRDDGEYVWLSDPSVLCEVLQDVVPSVCEANDHDLVTELCSAVLEESLHEMPFVCPNCGTDHVNVGNHIGGEWLVRQGEDTDRATYLLTRTFWPYLTHYTKTSEQYPNGLERLMAIVNDGVVRGTTIMVEGDRPAACFTECSPLEIHQMLEVMKRDVDDLPYGERAFEWSRSKHGVAVNRKSLVEYGGRPVIHGEASIRSSLGPDELWRFKLFDPGTELFDWTFEREFRVPDAFGLGDVDPRDIILIVENRAEQFQLLARRDGPTYAILPFDFVYSSEDPYPHLSDRQRRRQAERYL
jgi:hypothetical protein